MITTLLVLVHLARADERVVAVFARSNRVVVESRDHGRVTLRTCVLPVNRAEPPVTCEPLGVVTPDTDVAARAFDQALDDDDDIGQVLSQLRRGDALYGKFLAGVALSVAATVYLEAMRTRRYLGRTITRAELGAVLRAAGGFGLFAGGLFTTGYVFNHAHLKAYRRALGAFRRPPPGGNGPDGIAVINDIFGIYEEVVRAVDLATRRVAGEPAAAG